MNNITKFVLVLFAVFMVMSKAYSQNADPGIGILMNPPSVVQGSSGTLSATVGNYGNDAISANSLRVTIIAGANAEILGIAAGNDPRWTQSSLTPGSGNTIQLTNSAGGFTSFDVGDILLTVRGNTVGGPTVISGTIAYIIVDDPQGNAATTNDISQTSLTVTASTDLAITKTVNNQTPTVGTNVTFTITATNNGPSAATGVSVNDALPAGYTFVSATPSAGTSYTAPTWTIGNLANGASATLTIVATVNATGSYANTATISGNQSDPTPGNNSSTSTPVPVASSDLAVLKTVNNATPTVGTNVIFTITATNNGPSAATGVSVNDALPTGYTFVSHTASAGTSYTAPTWTIGNLANGASATLTITATVRATGIYANTATISGNQNDPTPGNNSSTSTPVPVASSDLAVLKTVNNATPTVGTNVIFTITATNNGPSAATGVSVNDALPTGYTFVSHTASAGTSYTASTWTIGNLANGASATLTITATVRATGIYANTATISGNQNDPTPGNNSSTSTPVPVASSDLAVLKTVNNATPTVGTNVIFTITATNNGPSAATGVSVNDALPTGYTFVSHTASAGTSYTAPNWTIGNLAVGASATLTITATVRATGIYANTATITGNQNDPTPGNNSSTSTPVPVAVDFTPTIDIDSVTFLSTGSARDFVVNISEILGNPSVGQVIVKIPKQSAFTITYGASTTTSNVFGGVTVNNSNWLITEDTLFITMTLKPGVIIGANSFSRIGFTITRNANVPSQTWQPITATIVNGSGSDSVNGNNTYNTIVKAQ